MAFKTEYACGCVLEDDVSPSLCEEHGAPATAREEVKEKKKSKK